MAGNTTFNKRQRERAQVERQRAKEEERQARKRAKADRPAAVDGVDPDIAGIIPGPQPRIE